MTLREEVHERIDQLDDAALSKLLVQLDALERETGRGFSKEFMDTPKRVRERNKTANPDDILREVTEEVNADRQSRR